MCEYLDVSVAVLCCAVAAGAVVDLPTLTEKVRAPPALTYPS